MSNRFESDLLDCPVCFNGVIFDTPARDESGQMIYGADSEPVMTKAAGDGCYSAHFGRIGTVRAVVQGDDGVLAFCVDVAGELVQGVTSSALTFLGGSHNQERLLDFVGAACRALQFDVDALIGHLTGRKTMLPDKLTDKLRYASNTLAASRVATAALDRMAGGPTVEPRKDLVRAAATAEKGGEL